MSLEQVYFSDHSIGYPFHGSLGFFCVVGAGVQAYTASQRHASSVVERNMREGGIVDLHGKICTVKWMDWTRYLFVVKSDLGGACALLLCKRWDRGAVFTEGGMEICRQEDAVLRL